MNARGLYWTGMEKVLCNGINFVQGIILARLLCPEDFGLTAMLGIFIAVGGTLADSGLTTALVVKGQGSRLAVLERSTFRWNLALAALIFTIFALAAPSVAAWYGKPILAPLMTAMAFGMVVNALSVVASARLWRTKSFAALAGLNSGSTLFGATLAVVLAYAGAGVWSIVAMCVGHSCVRTLAAWWLGRALAPDPAVDSSVSPPFRELLGYGLKLTASGVLDQAYVESYNLVLGKAADPSTVGLFARGERWSRLPGDVAGEVVERVALPTLTQEHAGMRAALGYVWLNALLLWPGIAILWIWAEEIVTFVFGGQWSACAPLLRILLLGQLAAPVSKVAQTVIRSRGCAGMVLRADAWKKPIGFAAMGVGIAFGVVGLCWAKVFSDVFGALVDLRYAVKAGGRK